MKLKYCIQLKHITEQEWVVGEDKTEKWMKFVICFDKPLTPCNKLTDFLQIHFLLSITLLFTPSPGWCCHWSASEGRSVTRTRETELLVLVCDSEKHKSKIKIQMLPCVVSCECLISLRSVRRISFIILNTHWQPFTGWDKFRNVDFQCRVYPRSINTICHLELCFFAHKALWACIAFLIHFLSHVRNETKIKAHTQTLKKLPLDLKSSLPVAAL